MLSPKDVLIFKLALERGLLDADRLSGALEQYPSKKSAARSLRALGVDGKAVGVLVDEATPTGTNDQGAIIARCDVENVLMGRALTNAQLVTAQELEAAQAVVNEQAAQGSFYGVTEILVEQGKLDVLRAAKLQLRARNLVATCPKCFQHHLLRARPTGVCSGCGEAIRAGEGRSAVDAVRVGAAAPVATTAREDAILERWAGTDPTVSAMPGQVSAYAPPKPELPALQPGLPDTGSNRFSRAEQSTIAGREQSMIVGEDASLNMAEAVAQFGAYEILEEVARGASGVVYKARLKEWSRPVALKVLVAGAKASEREIARFQREAEVGRAVQHPGLVKVFDSGIHAGYRYIAMEFVEGPTLEEVCVNPLPLGHAIEVVAGVCEAVGALHEQGVIHRDLKPSNIILRTKDGKPKLIDLGLVKTKAAGKLTQTASSVGTPAYMSPEQACGEREKVGEATDVYALGAILFFLVTAELPVMGENYMDLFRRIVQEDLTPPSRVNPALPASVDALILKAMAKQPADRYANPAELRAALLELDPAEAPVPASAPQPAPAPTPALAEDSIGKQLLVVFGLLVGAAVILAISYALLQRR